ncbi:MAG: outer membrane beta-barrel protein [Salinivirgaceae bacterium]|nr:outer membrane beta-barrel protein [Salinivirgaceae bacterium]
MVKAVIILIFNFYSVLIYCQPRNFIGGIFFNANGIQIEGNNSSIYWQNSNGSIMGGGGLSTGLSVKHYLLNWYYFNIELRYIQKGSVFAYLDPYATPYSEFLRLNYMELPISFGYQLNTKKTKYFIESGFAYAKLFSSKGNINEFVNRYGKINAEYFKDYDISWFSSLKFPVNRKSKENLLLGLRFSYSLFTIHEYYNLKNMVYGLQLDYIFNN